MGRMGIAAAAYTPVIEHSSECAEHAVPYKNYYMETAGEKANKEWAIELMVLVADRILNGLMVKFHWVPQLSRRKARSLK